VIPNTASLFFAMLAVACQLATVGIGALWVFGRRTDAWRRVSEELSPAALPLAWAVALVATAGSLFYSEYAHYVPCALCWYQRIAMYPLAVILAVAVLLRERSVWRYVLPLTIGGALISLYHYQLERFPSQHSVACTEAAPCTLVWVWKFHYISIPMMALSGFLFITTLVLVARKEQP
jgi:disulfide bond formation protein DsbB